MRDPALSCRPDFRDDNGADQFRDGTPEFALLDVDQNDFLIVHGVAEIDSRRLGVDDPSDSRIHHEVVETALERFEVVAGHVLLDADEVVSNHRVCRSVDQLRQRGLVDNALEDVEQGVRLVAMNIEIEVGAEQRFEDPPELVTPVLALSLEEIDDVGHDEFLLILLLRDGHLAVGGGFENVDRRNRVRSWIDVDEIVPATLREFRNEFVDQVPFRIDEAEAVGIRRPASTNRISVTG